MTYTMMRKSIDTDSEHGNWARKSRVTGILPDYVLADIVGNGPFEMPIMGFDPGERNFIGGAWRLPNDTFQPVRITNGYYHDRTCANRLRDRRELRNASAAQAAAERTWEHKAKERHTLEEGKRQMFFELLGSWRLFADVHGDGRDFMVLTERESPSAGRGYRRPAGKEFRLFLAQFVLLVTVSGAYTSQLCSRCGGHLKFARYKTDMRTKCCGSKQCVDDLARRRTAAQAGRDPTAPQPPPRRARERKAPPPPPTPPPPPPPPPPPAPTPPARRECKRAAPTKQPLVDRDTSAGIVFFHILEARARRAATRHDESTGAPTVPLSQ